jgi:hypothetical protein
VSIAYALRTCLVFLFCFSTIVSATAADKLRSASPIDSTPPRVLRFSASLSPDPATHYEPGLVGITFAIYAERDDEAPLWIGTQNVTIDEQGRFTVLLGESEDNAIPLDLFSSGKARWIGMQRIPERESERIMLVSVPYALKAADAETLGGKPLSAFVLSRRADAAKGTLTPAVNGAAGFIAKFIDTTNIDNSVLYESAGRIGLNTTSPQGPLHINSVITYRNGGVGSVQTGNNPGIMLENPSTNSTVLLSESFGFTVFASLSATAPLSGSDLRFVVRPTGNVGIAANNPQAPLHIAATRLYRSLNVAALQTGTNPGLMLENPATNSTVALTENNGLSIFVTPSSTLPFTGADLKMVLTTAGKVGIGTPSPAEKLDVAGNVKISGMGNALQFPDGTSQTTAAAGFVRTIIVSPGANPTASGTTLMNAINGITTNSSTNPYLIKIEPGIYDLGSTPLTMKPYVDIEGSGEGVTMITGSGSANQAGTVNGANNAELRFLTVQNTGTTATNFAIAIYNSGASPRLVHVTAQAVGTGLINPWFIGIWNVSSSAPTMTHVTALGSYQFSTNNAGLIQDGGTLTVVDSSFTGTGANAVNNRGIWVSNAASLTLINSTMSATTGGAGGGTGIYTSGTVGTLLLHRSTVNPTGTSIFNSTAWSVKVGTSQLTTAVNNFGAGTFVCVSSYNALFAALSTSCT